MKYLIFLCLFHVVVLGGILACDCETKIDPHVETLKRYSGKTVDHIWKEGNGTLRFYFKDGSYLKIVAHKYYFGLDTIRNYDHKNSSWKD